MKKLILLTSLFFLIAVFACSKSDAENEAGTITASKMKRYGIKEACIEYTVSGSQAGTEILYFDNYGIREAKHEKKTIKIGPITQEEDKATYLEDGVTQYIVNRKDGTGTKTKAKIMEQFEGKDMTKVGEKMMTQMGGKKIRTEEFLGRQTDVWEVKQMGTTTWVWKGVTLKTITDFMGMKVSIVATKISESFDKKKVQKPTNIDYKDMGDPMDMLKKMRQGRPKN